MARAEPTEHHLQKLLTARWLSAGIPIGEEVLTLVAWEVMLPSWRINDAHRGFGQPAVDFLGVDSQGGLVAIELKRRIGGEKAALRAACQVSHQVALIDQSKSLDCLAQAHEACFSGQDGRTEPMASALPAMNLSIPTRAILAARAWSRPAMSAIGAFNKRTKAENDAHLENRGLLTPSSTNRVCHRYTALGADTQIYVHAVAIDMPQQIHEPS